MSFTVVYDACVLYPATLRDLLIRLARTDRFRARWSDDILDEMVRGILRDRPDLDPAALERTRALMCEAVRGCLVAGYEQLIPSLELPDENDRHVLAAAIRAGAQVIVTHNLKDFPDAALAPFGIEAQSPDDFVLHLLELAPSVVAATVELQASALRNPPQTASDILDRLIRNGLARSAAEIRSLLA